MTEPHALLDASCRIAFAALLHDLGKFAERAALPGVDRQQLDAHLTLYCPFHEGRYHSHRHAAWTALMFDGIEQHVPDLIHGDVFPFAPRQGEGEATDSLINAAAMHHRPQTFLQWIIATADRVASGFEREEFEKYNASQDRIESKTPSGRTPFQARQLSLFEQIRLDEASPARNTAARLDWRYPLAPLSPKALFPVPRQGYEPEQDAPAQAEYRALWNGFNAALDAIPAEHRQQWPLWLDHFDTAWQCFTHAIPSATAFGIKPEVSLYDHSKTTAALATALWRWHEAHQHTGANAAAALKTRADWDEKNSCWSRAIFSASRISSLPTAARPSNPPPASCVAAPSRYRYLPNWPRSGYWKPAACRPPRRSSMPPANSSSSPPTPRTYANAWASCAGNSTTGSCSTASGLPAWAWSATRQAATTFSRTTFAG